MSHSRRTLIVSRVRPSLLTWSGAGQVVRAHVWTHVDTVSYEIRRQPPRINCPLTTGPTVPNMHLAFAKREH